VRIQFVADGPRDEVVLPLLVARILGATVESSFTGWPRLSGRGYKHKLVFAHMQAIDAGVDGLVAVVDRDRDSAGARMTALRQGREQERARTPEAPIALGQAEPHLEAWLLDDEVAVRRGLRLAAKHPIPNVAKCSNPKEEIETLREAAHEENDSVLAALSRIAAEVEPARCAHAKRTGFKAFHDDVRHELRPIAARRVVSPRRTPS
jgi:hypothetical protein